MYNRFDDLIILSMIVLLSAQLHPLQGVTVIPCGMKKMLVIPYVEFSSICWDTVSSPKLDTDGNEESYCGETNNYLRHWDSAIMH